MNLVFVLLKAYFVFSLRVIFRPHALLKVGYTILWHVFAHICRQIYCPFLQPGIKKRGYSCYFLQNIQKISIQGNLVRISFVRILAAQDQLVIYT